MCDWFDVRSTRDEFDSLVAAQAASLDADQETILETYRVVPWQAIMRRSEQMRYEAVWVLAEREGQVLYFDYVEWGWNLLRWTTRAGYSDPAAGNANCKLYCSN